MRHAGWRTAACMGLFVGIVVTAGTGFGGLQAPPPSSSSVDIINAGDAAVSVMVEFSDGTTTNRSRPMTTDAGALMTYRDFAAGNPWSGSVTVESTGPIAAAAPLIWQDPRGGTQWAAGSGGAPQASMRWYLAEGKTSDGFETYVTIQNVGDSSAQASVRFITHEGQAATTTSAVEQGACAQLNAAEWVPNTMSFSAVVEADQPVVAALHTTWANGLSSHTEVGSTSLATMWYLAEANTGLWSGFESLVLVSNPGSGTAQVTVQCIAEGQKQPAHPLQLPPMSQMTLNMSEYWPGQTHLTAVVTSDQPVLAARTMTWDDGQGFDPTMGTTAPAQQWYFPMARPSSEFSSWIALQNIGDATTSVTVEFVTDQGSYPGEDLIIDPFGDESISLPDDVQGTYAYGVVVMSDGPLLAQQGTYWQCGGLTHRDVNFGAPELSDTWIFPPYPDEPMGP